MINALTKEFLDETYQSNPIAEITPEYNTLSCQIRQCFCFLADPNIPLAIIIELSIMQIDENNMIAKDIGVGWSILPLHEANGVPDVLSFKSMKLSSYLTESLVCNSLVRIFDINSYK